MASATLTYVYADQVVFVDDLADEDHPMIHDLCQRHAGRVRAPQGWTCRDRRSVEIDLPPAPGAVADPRAAWLADRYDRVTA